MTNSKRIVKNVTFHCTDCDKELKGVAICVGEVISKIIRMENGYRDIRNSKKYCKDCLEVRAKKRGYIKANRGGILFNAR